MHQGGGHNFSDARLGRITVSGNDLVANIRHRYDSVDGILTGFIDNYTMDIATAHQRQRVRHAAIWINHDNRFAHPISHFGGHFNLQG